jgi:aminoglycoside phosphotransferase (APT) family kinase protein
MDRDEMEERLAAFVAQRVGIERATVSGLRRMAGGASREIWALDVQYEKAGVRVSLPLVLRRDPAAAGVGTLRSHEFRLLRAAHAHGVPVPRVHWFSDDSAVIGAPFFLMDRIDGETIPRRLLRDDAYARARQVMIAQLSHALAAIHGIDRAAHDLDFLPDPPPGESPAENELDRYEQLYRLITPDPHPALELALRWLRERLPPGNRRVVVHGDFRIGNVIFGPEGLRAVLDWELSHIGDPMEDLGWFCVRSWRFGNDDKPAGGIGTREELFRGYEAAGGAAVDPHTVRYWEVLGNFKWAIMTIMQAKTHLDGHVKSVELASLGRRTAEMELELLNLITDRT